MSTSVIIGSPAAHNDEVARNSLAMYKSQEGDVEIIPSDYDARKKSIMVDRTKFFQSVAVRMAIKDNAATPRVRSERSYEATKLALDICYGLVGNADEAMKYPSDDFIDALYVIHYLNHDAELPWLNDVIIRHIITECKSCINKRVESPTLKRVLLEDESLDMLENAIKTYVNQNLAELYTFISKNNASTNAVVEFVTKYPHIPIFVLFGGEMDEISLRLRYLKWDVDHAEEETVAFATIYWCRILIGESPDVVIRKTLWICCGLPVFNGLSIYADYAWQILHKTGYASDQSYQNYLYMKYTCRRYDRQFNILSKKCDVIPAQTKDDPIFKHVSRVVDKKISRYMVARAERRAENFLHCVK